MLGNKTYKEIERALNEERYKEYLLNYPKVIGTEDGALVYNELLRINKIPGYESEKVQKDIDALRKTHELKIIPKYFDANIFYITECELNDITEMGKEYIPELTEKYTKEFDAFEEG